MRNKVLIVDDSELNRELLVEILQDDYDIITCSNGSQALDIVYKDHERIAVILLDLMMPVLDGYGVLEALSGTQYMNDIPVLIISGENEMTAEQRCFELGVSDFIKKPFDNTLVKKRVQNITEMYLYKNNLEEQVKKQTEIISKQYDMLKEHAEKLASNNVKIIEVLGNIVEYRNIESGEHIQRVKMYTRILGEQMMEDYPEYGLTPEKLDIIVSASALHDVGKISIPDSILLKPGRLTDEEFEYMKQHTTKGCDIIDSMPDIWSDEYKEACYEICRHHHERYDGRGYPDKLAGDDIPISAQIVSLADVYDALVNERVYKKAFPKDKAYEMIMNNECGVFSPKIYECFKKIRPKFEEMAG